MIEVDARGLSCPIPVVKTKAALDENPNQPVTVLVDNPVAKENVARLARSKGYTITIEKTADGYKIELNPAS
ncbi:MAG: sulfurtransferase TusA family protein [Dehalococcoidia bacterium]|nr:sulfurtransferase TusA family protein [Dehalococcoidia bacterium]